MEINILYEIDETLTLISLKKTRTFIEIESLQASI